MNRTLLVSAGIGLVVVLAFVGVVMTINKGSHMMLEGSVQKVRTLALDENSTVLVADFRAINPANYAYNVRSVTMTLDDDTGKPQEGMRFPEIDAKRLFEGYPVLGPKYNDTLKAGDKLASKSTGDFMIAARFEIPEAKVQARKKLRISIEEVNGLVTILVQ
jgi:hypothetical protein